MFREFGECPWGWSQGGQGSQNCVLPSSSVGSLWGSVWNLRVGLGDLLILQLKGNLKVAIQLHTHGSQQAEVGLGRGWA